MDPTRNQEVAGSIPGLDQWVKDLVCCHELSSKSQTWCRPAAIVLIGPLAWDPPYAAGTAPEKTKKKKKSTKER